MIAPMDDPILYNTEGPGFWRDRIHDLDFSSLQAIELSQGRVAQFKVEQAALLAPGQAIIDLDTPHRLGRRCAIQRPTRDCFPSATAC